MTRHILVPLDGSSLAELALPHAVAATSGAGLERWDHETDAARDYLASLAGRLEAAGLTVQTEVSEDGAASAIMSYVEQHAEVSLVAMATHGHSGVNRWIFGSITEKMLHASLVPLLVLR